MYEDGLGIRLGSGLTTNPNGITLKVDGGLQMGSDGYMRIKLGSNASSGLKTSGGELNINVGEGLEIGTNGGALQLKLELSSGINFGSK
jgi:hypothetical protein